MSASNSVRPEAAVTATAASADFDLMSLPKGTLHLANGVSYEGLSFGAPIRLVSCFRVCVCVCVCFRVSVCVCFVCFL
jgi:hypothetical protein